MSPTPEDRELFERLVALREQYTADAHDEPTEPVAAVVGQALPVHTRGGQPIPLGGLPYGVTHDLDCPACVASGRPWGADPRSEAYWSA